MQVIGKLFPLLMLGVASFSWAAGNCTVTKNTCLQGPETRTIQGVKVYRDCWQWETVTECQGSGTINYCSPLEKNGACKETASECLSSSKPGVCEVRKKSFSCSAPLSPVPNGVTALPVQSSVSDKFETGKYCSQASNASCSQTKMICTAPDQTRVVDGVSVTLPCWERELSYSCITKPENPSCGYLTAAGCKPSSNKEKAQTLTYDCQENATITPHEDIHFVEKLNILDGVKETENTCGNHSCTVSSTTCLSYHPIFTDVCLSEQTQLVCESGEKKTCEFLTEKGCVVKSEEIDSTLFYCSAKYPDAPTHIEWSGSEEIITGMTEDSNCPFSSTLTRAPQPRATCEVTGKICTEGAETRIVNGTPVYKDCWRYEVQYGCTNDESVNTCEDLSQNSKCQLIEKKCLAGSEASCSFWTYTYSCEETPETVIEEEVCTESICQHGLCTPTDDAPNTGLADAVTKLEVVRQAAVYGDYKNLKFFTGEMNTCRNKVGGVSCCKGKVKGSHANASGLPVSYVFAADIAKETIHTLGSPYVNDILMSNETVASVMTELYGEAAGQAYSPNLSYYGLSVSYVGGSLQFSFDPWTFFAMVALEVASEYLSCTQEEQALQLKRGADTCRYVGSVCTEYFMGQCLIKTESHCCYNSKLALLVQEAAHEQLGRPWDVTDSQVCQGLTAWEMSQVDLGQIDPEALGALIDTSKITLPNSENVKIRGEARKEELKKDPYADMPGKEGTCYGTDC